VLFYQVDLCHISKRFTEKPYLIIYFNHVPLAPYLWHYPMADGHVGRGRAARLASSSSTRFHQRCCRALARLLGSRTEPGASTISAEQWHLNSTGKLGAGTARCSSAWRLPSRFLSRRPRTSMAREFPCAGTACCSSPNQARWGRGRAIPVIAERGRVESDQHAERRRAGSGHRLTGGWWGCRRA
jgi:hypothetical protein